MTQKSQLTDGEFEDLLLAQYHAGFSEHLALGKIKTIIDDLTTKLGDEFADLRIMTGNAILQNLAPEKHEELMTRFTASFEPSADSRKSAEDLLMLAKFDRVALLFIQDIAQDYQKDCEPLPREELDQKRDFLKHILVERLEVSKPLAAIAVENFENDVRALAVEHSPRGRSI